MSTQRTLEFEDMRAMFQPMEPDRATHGVEEVATLDTSTRDFSSVGEHGLQSKTSLAVANDAIGVGNALHEKPEGLKYQPPTSTGKGMATESLNSVANLGMETMHSLFGMLNPDPEPAPELEPKLAMQQPKPTAFAI